MRVFQVLIHTLFCFIFFDIYFLCYAVSFYVVSIYEPIYSVYIDTIVFLL